MNAYAAGSEWRKWDLHVHTPSSIVNGYGGDWDRFLAKIENLPQEFSVTRHTSLPRTSGAV